MTSLAAAPAPAARRVPERTCIGCRATRPKPELVRLVLPPQGPVEVDLGGRRNGRGAYICRQTGTTCLAQARRRRALVRALRTSAERVDADALAAALAALISQSGAQVPAWGVGPAGSARRQSRGASPPPQEESPSPR